MMTYRPSNLMAVKTPEYVRRQIVGPFEHVTGSAQILGDHR